MSDFNPFIEEGEGPPEGSPDIVGVAAEDGQTTEQIDEGPPKSYLDVDDDIAERYVRVRVDGEEMEVPLREALQGYSRTADYTRKTQELASQRQQAEYALAVQRALQAQPDEALRLLARQYGVTFEQSPPAQPGAPSYDDGEEDDPYMDPLERRLNEQQRLIDQLAYEQERRQADGVLRAAVGGLQRKYNLDEATTREIVGQALQAGRGPESFEIIYKSIAFDRANQAREIAQQQRQQSETQRRAAGQNASQLIGQGGSANGVGRPVGEVNSDGRMSIREAYDAALNQLGG